MIRERVGGGGGYSVNFYNTFLTSGLGLLFPHEVSSEHLAHACSTMPVLAVTYRGLKFNI